MAERQVKSQARVAEHGEVFTAQREVSAMLDLVKQETERIDSRFLEPACGDGNFLAEILRRKLAAVKARYRKSPADFEKYAVVAATSIYGVDILQDNVDACRARLFDIWDGEYAENCKGECREDCREAVRYILTRNILCGNALTMRRVDAGGNDTDEPIIFSEWALTGNSSVRRSDYLLMVSGKQGYYLAKMDGTPLTGDLYKGLSCTNGWITGKNVEIEGWNQGVLSAIDGSIVVPFIYGDVKILNKNWGLAFNLIPASADNYDYESWTNNEYRKLYIIDTVDVYWLPTASKLATIPRANYMGSKAYDAYINIEDRATSITTTYDLNMNPLGTVRDIYTQDHIPHYSTFRYYNGQQGLLDPDGNEVFSESYQYVNESGLNGFFEVSIGDMHGLVDSEGNVVVPVDYSKINCSYYSPSDLGSTFVNFGYVCIEKDKCMGYYRINTSESCPPKYSSALLENNGVSALFTDMSGNLNIMAADGEENILTGYEKVYPLNNAAGALYKVNNADYKYGLIDWHGKEILPMKYDTIELSANGHFLLASESHSTPAEIYYVSYGGTVESAQETEAAK